LGLFFNRQQLYAPAQLKARAIPPILQGFFRFLL
jgi:hypothetical protein